MEHKTIRTAAWKSSDPDHFTGSVWNDKSVDNEGGLTMNAVQFSPGARTAWHSHRTGQILYVVSGSGLVHTKDETVAISPGDVIYAPADKLHWHGARPDSPMMHMSFTTGASPDWGDKVSDEAYEAALTEGVKPNPIV